MAPQPLGRATFATGELLSDRVPAAGEPLPLATRWAPSVNLIGHAFEVFGIGDDIRMAASALQAAAVACCVIHHTAAGAGLPLQVVPMAATAGRSWIWSDRQPRSGGAGWASGAVFLCQRGPEPRSRNWY